MSIDVNVQYAVPKPGLPAATEIESWACAALTQAKREHAALTVRIVDEQESADLNQTFRQRSGPTNVLSFPFAAPAQVASARDYLGDLVICAPVVVSEASEQHKDISAHWAHMVVHGSLHLLGYDHLSDEQAHEMEALETKILADIGYPDPYLETQTL